MVVCVCMLAKLNDDILRLDDAIKSCGKRNHGRENMGARAGGTFVAQASFDPARRPGPLYEIQVARDGKRLMAL